MPNAALSLADNLKSFGIRSAYGDPVDVNGTTIVPVALVWFGFGAGQDKSTESGESANGGGGGGVSIPVGVYVTTANGVVFQPNLVSLLAVSIPVICTSGWALSKIIRALKK